LERRVGRKKKKNRKRERNLVGREAISEEFMQKLKGVYTLCTRRTFRQGGGRKRGKWRNSMVSAEKYTDGTGGFELNWDCCLKKEELESPPY